MPLFSIPLSGLTASSTAMSTIANNLTNAEAARNATVQAASSLSSMTLMDYLSSMSQG